MQITVKTISSRRTIPVEVEPNDKIASIKTKIADEAGIKAEEQRLVIFGQTLEDDYTISDYNIQDGATLTVVLRLGK